MKNVGFLKKSLLVFWALTMFTACEKDTEPVSFEPEMSVLPAEGEYRFGATVSGSVNKNGSAIVKEYGIQLQEKQRVRFTYGVSEKQLRIDYKGGVDNMYYDDPRLSRAAITRAVSVVE